LRAALVISIILLIASVAGAVGGERHRAAVASATLCGGADWLARQAHAEPLPDDALEYLPIPPNGYIEDVRVRQGPADYPAQDQAAAFTVTSFGLRAPARWWEIRAFYHETLLAHGWCYVPPDPPNPAAIPRYDGMGGHGPLYCRTVHGPSLGLGVYETSGPALIGVGIRNPSPKHCGRFDMAPN
jgi:hypothetical protein